MNALLTMAMVLVVVAVSLVAVCEQSEACRLRHRVWRIEQRVDSLDRQLRAQQAERARTLTPRRLLSQDGIPGALSCDIGDPETIGGVR